MRIKTLQTLAVTLLVSLSAGCITPLDTSKQGQPQGAASSKVIKVDYTGFTVWLDCKRRGAVKFQYNAQHDTGNLPRSKNFYLDPKIPAGCQQTSSKGYNQGYDRGHLVPANHLDYSKQAVHETNSMANILPQAASMNRGAWLLTEEIVECYRDIDELLVIGGVMWGDNADDDYFISDHRVATPDAFWKVVIRGSGEDERAIAWIVPNLDEATMDQLDTYIVSIDELEKMTGEKIPVADYVKHEPEPASWLIPHGCDRGLIQPGTYSGSGLCVRDFNKPVSIPPSHTYSPVT
jgi:endonuclease G, mitochondrial